MFKMKRNNKTSSKPKRKHPTKDAEDFDSEYQEPKKWYAEQIGEPQKFNPVTEQVLIELKDEAKLCNDQEVENFNAKKSKNNPNHQWMKTMMSQGTVSDKIAAHTVTVQDNPVCNLETLRNLVGMVKVGKKKECFTVMETLTELFLTSLLRPKVVLKSFHERALSALNDMTSGNAIKRRKVLSLWYFEDQLKEIYMSFVLALNRAAQDSVENNKEKALTAMFKLLCGSIEQKKNLLAYIVNKLGDPSQKVASKAIYCLTQLLLRRRHANKQEMVLKEVEKLLFRPNIGNRAQYYSLCFLSQFYLSHEAPDVAKKLIELYLAFFKACVKKGDVDSRMMSAILMGINRAYPYSKMGYDDMAEHVDTLYKLVHLANFNISIQVLLLLHHVTIDKMADRFYGALYRKLLDPRLLTTTHQAMLLSLLFKSLRKDTQANRVKMFIKRLLQISSCVHPAFSCGILYTVSQLIGKNPDLQALVLQPTTVNLNNFDDDEDEKYYDIKDEDDIEIKTEEEDQTLNVSNATAVVEIKDEDEDEKPDLDALNSFVKGQSWCHKNLTKTSAISKNVFKYNPLARNPLYGGGEYCAYVELLNLKNHFHPTVSLYASNILNGQVIRYSGDPLKDFSLIKFLERFVFKNPKKVEEKPGIHPTLGVRKFYKPKGVKLLSVRSKNYINTTEKSIPVEELFLHSYLQKRYQNAKIKEEDDEDSDLESVKSEEFEDMLDKIGGLGKDETDYMNEIGDNLKHKDSKRKKRQEDDDLDPDDDDLELMDDVDGDSDEDIEFGESDDEETPSKSLKKKKNEDVSSLFASAEEFASMLEDEGSSEYKPGTSNVLENKEKAGKKQLAWEDKRNQWIRGFNKNVNRQFGKKRPRKVKFEGKNKKFKR